MVLLRKKLFSLCMTQMNIEKQKERIIQKLDEIYGFGFIEDFISLDLILGPRFSYTKNVKLLKEYLSEDLMISVRGPDMEKIMGNEYFLRLKEDISCDEFERFMTEEE